MQRNEFFLNWAMMAICMAISQPFGGMRLLVMGMVIAKNICIYIPKYGTIYLPREGILIEDLVDVESPCN